MQLERLRPCVPRVVRLGVEVPISDHGGRGRLELKSRLPELWRSLVLTERLRAGVVGAT
jgi:hypothetical protein